MSETNAVTYRVAVRDIVHAPSCYRAAMKYAADSLPGAAQLYRQRRDQCSIVLDPPEHLKGSVLHDSRWYRDNLVLTRLDRFFWTSRESNASA